MMESQWYFQTEGGDEGPLTAATLKKCAASSIVKPDTLVRKGTDGKWVPASRVKGLFETAQSAPAPRYTPNYTQSSAERPTDDDLVFDEKQYKQNYAQSSGNGYQPLPIGQIILAILILFAALSGALAKFFMDFGHHITK